jgi:hypothetical protein
MSSLMHSLLSFSEYDLSSSSSIIVDDNKPYSDAIITSVSSAVDH